MMDIIWGRYSLLVYTAVISAISAVACFFSPFFTNFFILFFLFIVFKGLPTKKEVNFIELSVIR